MSERVPYSDGDIVTIVCADWCPDVESFAVPNICARSAFAESDKISDSH